MTTTPIPLVDRITQSSNRRELFPAINGLDSRKHSGVVSLFNRHFIKSGKLDKHWAVVLKDARRSREMADYTEIAEFSRQDAEEQMADAEAFVRAVENLIAKME